MKNNSVEIKKSRNQSTLLYNSLFFTSICLWIWGIMIYRNTIINGHTILMTIAVGVLISNILLPLVFRLDYSRFLRIVGHSVIGGSLFYSFLLFSNKSFADNNILIESFLIKEKGTLGKGRYSACRKPFARIDFHGTVKELVFRCDDDLTLKTADSIRLEYSEGGLGFEIIRSMRIVP